MQGVSFFLKGVSESTQFLLAFEGLNCVAKRTWIGWLLGKGTVSCKESQNDKKCSYPFCKMLQVNWCSPPLLCDNLQRALRIPGQKEAAEYLKYKG